MTNADNNNNAPTATIRPAFAYAQRGSNRFVVATAALPAFVEILNAGKFATLAATRSDRSDGASFASVVLSNSDRDLLTEYLTAVLPIVPALKTTIKRYLAATDATATRFHGIATPHAVAGRDTAVFHIGLVARTLAA